MDRRENPRFSNREDGTANNDSPSRDFVRRQKRTLGYQRHVPSHGEVVYHSGCLPNPEGVRGVTIIHETCSLNCNPF